MGGDPTLILVGVGRVEQTHTTIPWQKLNNSTNFNFVSELYLNLLNLYYLIALSVKLPDYTFLLVLKQTKTPFDNRLRIV